MHQFSPLIPTYSPGQYHQAIKRIDGFSSLVHIADLSHEDGRYFRAYVKAYPPDSRGVPNELVHWVLNSALSMPQPQFAAFLLCPVDVLSTLYPDVDWRAYDDEVYPCFATNALSSPIPKRRMRWMRDPKMIADLRAWPHLPVAIAADEWMHQDDGNFDNLLRIAPGEFARIDGGRIFGGDKWTTQSLRTLGRLANKLLHIACRGMPDDEMIEAIHTASDSHSHALEMSLCEILYWLYALIGEHDAAAALEWLQERAKSQFIRSRYAVKKARPAS